MALLPFPLAVAKSAGAPVGLTACQKMYTKKATKPTVGCSKISYGKTDLIQNVHKCLTADFYLCSCFIYV